MIPLGWKIYRVDLPNSIKYICIPPCRDPQWEANDIFSDIAYRSTVLGCVSQEEITENNIFYPRHNRFCVHGNFSTGLCWFDYNVIIGSADILDERIFSSKYQRYIGHNYYAARDINVPFSINYDNKNQGYVLGFSTVEDLMQWDMSQ